MDMETMEMMHQMQNKLCKQMWDYIEVQNLGGKALEDVANLVKTIKNLDIIFGMHGESQGGYSQRGQSMGSYDDGASYRRGRDSMGRYTSRDDGASMRGGSYHDGGDEETRRAIEEIKRKLDKMM